MKQDPAKQYLRMAARSATPVGLIVVLHDIALDSLHRAVNALREGDIEKRSTELNRALSALGQLQGALNFDKGGEVAHFLERFYTVVRGKILEAQLKASDEMLQRIANDFVSLREAWQEVERKEGGSATPAVLPAGTPGKKPGEAQHAELAGVCWSA